MPKIKIFNPNNVQQYGFTVEEIEALNAEWEQKASELGLEEHLPEYWQEAKRHVSEKLDGMVAESPDELELSQPDGEAIELPSLDVDLDDLDIAGEDEITAAALSDEEIAGEEAFEELPELESISADDLELEVSPEEPEKAAEQEMEEKAAQEGTVAPDDVTDLQLADTAPEPEAAAEESVEEEIPEQETVPVEEPEKAAEQEMEEEAAQEETIAPDEEQKAESFLGKIIGRLKRMF
ncbi:MAG: hypothetical protein KQH63_06120 [Desulfobulbaceae bacterium]|nr:hypothetical protein [Desulfobulbaceae bacterium]